MRILQHCRITYEYTHASTLSRIFVRTYIPTHDINGEKQFSLLRMNARLPRFLNNISKCCMLTRKLNCWTAGITKKHRKIYERTYPTVLVFPNGSTINIQYSEPRRIIKLPVDLSLLSEAERKKLLEKRVPKSKVVIEEDIDDDYDEKRYLNYVRR